MKKIKGLVSLLSSAVILSAMPLSVSADNSESISLGKDMECASGQSLAMTIDISACNDFESAQFEFTYSDTDIDISKIYAASPNLSIASKIYKEEGYAIICIYSNNGQPIEDGTVVDIGLTLPEKEGEYTFGLTASVFAEFKKGEVDVEDATVTYSAIKKLGDANGDNVLNIRDAAFISRYLASPSYDKEDSSICSWADFTGDGIVNVRDAAAIARMIACAGRKN